MILVIDVETTGLIDNPSERTHNVDKFPFVIQISFQVYSSSGDLMIQYDSYVNPGVDNKAVHINGISNELLIQKGVEIYEPLKMVCAMIEWCDLIIGHNIAFDLRMLRVELYRNGLDHFNDLLKNANKFCTMYHGRKYLSSSKMVSLKDMYEAMFSKSADFHNSLVDVRCTSRCFWKMVEEGYCDSFGILSK